ncbi:hypothetical protein [Mesoflavibacter zeaxanthinifaciens]|uniref:hypothetical protein n=1 Tax=Mesoflavibacter zeaxanthinifaciens TaxID=393060 RepID=UPI0004807385|nr:hypothetical protein [Mesoflavibacter zeaxanthinifaciens]
MSRYSKENRKKLHDSMRKREFIKTAKRTADNMRKSIHNDNKDGYDPERVKVLREARKKK